MGQSAGICQTENEGLVSALQEKDRSLSRNTCSLLPAPPGAAFSSPPSEGTSRNDTFPGKKEHKRSLLTGAAGKVKISLRSRGICGKGACMAWSLGNSLLETAVGFTCLKGCCFMVVIIW